MLSDQRRAQPEHHDLITRQIASLRDAAQHPERYPDLIRQLLETHENG